MLPPDTTSPGFFENRYRRVADPWNFAHSEYEQGRFRAIATALEGREFRLAFEPGCSIGTLTEHLAPMCQRLEAFDFAETAVQRARVRCAHLPNVTVGCAALSLTTDVSSYDLVILSEIGYYFSATEWRAMVAHLTESLAPGATLLASHWLGKSDDHLQSGDAVHNMLEAEPRLTVEHKERHPGFRLTRLQRT